MAEPIPHPQLEALRVGWEESVRSTISIGKSLTEEEWLRPSPCPGWRLKDLISHLIGIEELLLDPNQVITEAIGDRPWIKNEFGQFNEIAVDLRRNRTGAEILVEFERIVEVRNAAWKVEPRTPDTEVFFAPIGQVQLGLLLWRRVFDAWAHNQDLQIPLELVGGLDGKAIALIYPQVAKFFAITFAKKCAPPAAATISIVITGARGFAYSARINEQGRGESVKEPIANPSASIRMSAQDWYLLTCGREGREKVVLEIGGDQELAERVIANFTIAP